ncbi:MAG: hypothetical protein AAB693_00710 [Patescibacteria group bacterium]
MKNTNPKLVCGYTIIETMVSISVFLIAILIGMSALLNANSTQRKANDMRAILDNLSFIMEDISRNLRMGNGYSCDNNNCKKFSFTGSDGNGWSYEINLDKKVIRDVIKNSISDPVILNSEEIKIDSVNSGFTIINNTTGKQSFVIIKLSGEIKSKDVTTPFSLQTSVSRRALE